MKRIIIALVVFTVLVSLALVLSIVVKPPPRGTDLLPQSTLIFVQVPNMPESRTQFRDTAAYALWQEPDVQRVVHQFRNQLSQKTTGKPQVPGGALPWADLIQLPQGEMFFAVVDITAKPKLSAGLVVGANVKGKESETEQWLNRLRAELTRQSPDVAWESKKFLGVKYGMLDIEPGRQVCHALLNSMLVVTLGEDTMRDIITRHTQPAESKPSSLTDSPKFKNIVSQMPKGYELMAYLNVEEVTMFVAPLLALTKQSSGAMQKMARQRAVGDSFVFEDHGVHELRLTTYKTPTTKLPGPLQRKTLALTTPTTMLYSVQHMDWSGAYDDLIQVIAQIKQQGDAPGTAEFEKSMREKGVRVREDLLAKLGPETAIIANWRPGTKFPDFAVVTELADAGKTAPALAALMNHIKQMALGDDQEFPWQQSEFQGVALRSTKMGEGPVAPTYGVVDGFFILASAPEYARELIAQLRAGKPNLTANADYEKAMARLPARGSSYMYCDLRTMFPPLYELIQTNLTGMATNTVGEIPKLPQIDTVTRHLWPYCAVSVPAKQSETTISYSPFGSPLAVVLGAAGGMMVLQSFGPDLEQTITSVLPKTISDKVAPPVPPENQKEESQTPAPQ